MKAEIIANALGGRKTGRGWMARCPAHVDREPSLSIRVVRCHAGCDQARVIAALRSRRVWDENGHRYRRLSRLVSHATANDQLDRDDAKRSEAALAIWHSATPAGGTLVETYLISRGLHLPPPPTLRFHSGLKHPSGGIWPAMVALVTQGGGTVSAAVVAIMAMIRSCPLASSLPATPGCIRVAGLPGTPAGRPRLSPQ